MRYDLVRAAETTGSLTGTLTGLVSDGRPRDALVRSAFELRTLTLGDLNELSRSGLYDWSGLAVVIVGDAQAVLPQLEQAGFPSPLRLDPEGRPIR